MSDHWIGYRTFEKIVAAIHRVSQIGSRVQWDDKIKGRQFDISVRTKMGLYDYLTVIECKHHVEPVSVDLVDALATKSRDVGADKAVLISASGFQSGAIEVAKRHNIELLTADEIDELPPGCIDLGIRPHLRVYGIQVIPADAGHAGLFELFEEQDEYLAKETVLQVGERAAPISAIIDNEYPKFEAKARRRRNLYSMKFADKPIARPPFPADKFRVRVSGIRFFFDIADLKIVDAKGLDPRFLPTSWKLKSAITNQEHVFGAAQIAEGLVVEFVPGRFYRNVVLGLSYVCESVSKEEIRMHMFESYQHGRYITCRITFKPENGKGYVSVDQRREVLRLKTLYGIFCSRLGEQPVALSY